MKKILLSAAVLWMLTACVKEDYENCPLDNTAQVDDWDDETGQNTN